MNRTVVLCCVACQHDYVVSESNMLENFAHRRFVAADKQKLVIFYIFYPNTHV